METNKYLNVARTRRNAQRSNPLLVVGIFSSRIRTLYSIKTEKAACGAWWELRNRLGVKGSAHNSRSHKRKRIGKAYRRCFDIFKPQVRNMVPRRKLSNE